MNGLKYNKAIFCIIAIALIIIQFIPITSASIKNTEVTPVPNVIPNQKFIFFSHVIINLKSGTIGSYMYNPPVVFWRANGEISITGIGDKYQNNGQLTEGILTLFIGTVSDSQIQGFALVSWSAIVT